MLNIHVEREIWGNEGTMYFTHWIVTNANPIIDTLNENYYFYLLSTIELMTMVA